MLRVASTVSAAAAGVNALNRAHDLPRDIAASTEKLFSGSECNGVPAEYLPILSPENILYSKL
jgi:hypothetical protein